MIEQQGKRRTSETYYCIRGPKGLLFTDTISWTARQARFKLNDYMKNYNEEIARQMWIKDYRAGFRCVKVKVLEV